MKRKPKGWILVANIWAENAWILRVSRKGDDFFAASFYGPTHPDPADCLPDTKTDRIIKTSPKRLIKKREILHYEPHGNRKTNIRASL